LLLLIKYVLSFVRSTSIVTTTAIVPPYLLSLMDGWIVSELQT